MTAVPGGHPRPFAKDEGILDRALGAYLGFAIGDALGATVEFLTPREIARDYGVHARMIGGGWLKLKPGQVTDDTEMALCIGRAMLRARGWSLKGVCDEFAVWLKKVPIDVGNTTRRGIRRYIVDGSMVAPASDGDGGNGAAIRNLPVALATLASDQDFATWTLEQCHITHNHPLSDAAALALGRMLRRLVLGGGVAAAREEARALIEKHREFRFDRFKGPCTGYVVDTVCTVLHEYFLTELDTFVHRPDGQHGRRCGFCRSPCRHAVRRYLRRRVDSAALDEATRSNGCWGNPSADDVTAGNCRQMITA